MGIGDSNPLVTDERGLQIMSNARARRIASAAIMVSVLALAHCTRREDIGLYPDGASAPPHDGGAGETSAPADGAAMTGTGGAATAGTGGGAVVGSGGAPGSGGA